LPDSVVLETGEGAEKQKKRTEVHTSPTMRWRSAAAGSDMMERSGKMRKEERAPNCRFQMDFEIVA
jgi:hypothetical protein